MDAPQVLERTRQQLIKKLLERKKDIERQLEQLGHKQKTASWRCCREATSPLLRLPGCQSRQHCPVFRIRPRVPIHLVPRLEG